VEHERVGGGMMVGFCRRQPSNEGVEVDAESGVGPHLDDIELAQPHQRGDVTPSASGAHGLLVAVLPHATVDDGVVHHAKVRFRIGVKVGIHVLLCAAEVGEANGGEVFVEDLPDVRGGKFSDCAERLVQS
jgi:hypothetical protein